MRRAGGGGWGLHKNGMKSAIFMWRCRDVILSFLTLEPDILFFFQIYPKIMHFRLSNPSYFILNRYPHSRICSAAKKKRRNFSMTKG